MKKLLLGWKSWSFGSDAPDNDGILAGHTERHEKSFVGRADVGGQLVIGKLLIDGPYAGVYLPWGGQEHKKTEGVQYYAKDNQCTYSWKQSSNGRHVENAVGFTSQQYTFYVGRTYHSDSVLVGKVTLELKKMLYSYAGVETGVSNYEVLVCDKNPTVDNTNANGGNFAAGGSSAAASAASTANVNVNVNVNSAASASSSSSSN